MSSLNDILFQKIKNLLHQGPGYSERTREALVNLCPWTPELIDEVSRRLLSGEISESLVTELCEWSEFLFLKSSDLSEPIPHRIILSEKSYELCGAINFILCFASRGVKIPYKYWADIAPHLLQEIRRFYFSSNELWSQFMTDQLDFKPVEAKQDELRTNPETAELFAEWDKDHIFS